MCDDTVHFSNCQFIKHDQQAFVVPQSDQCSSTVMLLYTRSLSPRHPPADARPEMQHDDTKAEKDRTENVTHSDHRLLYLTATSRQPKDQNITERREFRTRATRPASNRPLSQNGHQSAYCWAQTEPSFLWAIPISISAIWPNLPDRPTTSQRRATSTNMDTGSVLLQPAWYAMTSWKMATASSVFKDKVGTWNPT